MTYARKLERNKADYLAVRNATASWSSGTTHTLIVAGSEDLLVAITDVKIVRDPVYKRISVLEDGLDVASLDMAIILNTLI